MVGPDKGISDLLVIGSFGVADRVDRRTRFERHPDVLWRSFLGGVLVLAPGQLEPLCVSTPGDLTWLLLAQPSSLDELAADLADLFGLEPDAVRTDILGVLKALLEIAAITRHPV